MKRILLFLTVVCLSFSKVQAQVIDTVLNKVSEKPFYFSVPVDDGNYLVTVTLGAKKRAAQTVVRAESRRLMVENCVTKKNQYETWRFIVSKRSPDHGVKLKEREKDYLNWDELLTLEFNGSAPAVKSIRIEPDYCRNRRRKPSLEFLVLHIRLREAEVNCIA